MNRKIKYLFFLVSFITVNVAILILALSICIILSELVFSKIQITFFNTSLSNILPNILGLFCGAAISIALYRRLYRYAEKKWYIQRIFDLSHRNSLDL